MLKKRLLFISLKNLVNPLLVSFILVACVWFYTGQFEGDYIPLLVLSFLLVVQFMDGVNFESNNIAIWKKTIVSIVLQWILVISIVMLVGFASKATDNFSRQVLIAWFLITPAVLVLMHVIICFFARRWLFAEFEASKAIIVGVNDSSRKLASQFNKNPLLGVSCMGFFDDRQVDRILKKKQPKSETLLGSIGSVAKFVKAHNLQHIYIALPMAAQPRTMALLDDLRDTTASVYFVPDMFLFNTIQPKVSTIENIPIVAVCETPFVGNNDTIKRFSDVLLSLMFLLVIAPLMLIIAIGVKLSSPGPVLFKQRRYGLDGKEILVYKFRSMTVMEDGEKVNQATRNDPRITRFGSFLRKTSLDELPQFINVLQGRMSIVGPRPHAISHNETYRHLIKGYMVRHKVKPGITGWAQVNGFRGETDTVDKMQSRIDYDLDYLRNWSLLLDLMIIFKTISVVIKDKNAY